jgi:50S ribosomal protein L16 3-hydroxylase
MSMGMSSPSIDTSTRPRRLPGDAKPPSAVAALLGLDDPRDFLDGAWPERTFLAHGPIARLRGLVDYELDDLLRMKKSFTKAFVHTHDSARPALHLSPGQERALYDAGHTIYFHGLRAPGLDAWVDALEEELGLVRGATTVSAFALRRGPGLRTHYDRTENFVCQAQGTKRWRVAPNDHVRYPSVGHFAGAPLTPTLTIEAPNGLPASLPEPHETIDLEPGSVLFVPRGVWHDTEALEEPSLHFAIQTELPSWKDVALYALETCPASLREELRAPVLGLFRGEALAPERAGQLQERLALFVNELTASGIAIDRSGFDRWAARRRG